MNKIINNDKNEIEIKGMIASEPKFAYEVYGEKFYSILVNVKRLSDKNDTLEIIYSERLLIDLKISDFIIVNGEMRTYNEQFKDKYRLKVFVFAKSIERIQKVDSTNHVLLEGYICKQPIYRKTPKNREITDAMIAVNRDYFKAGYIPVIFWGRNAKFTSILEIGTHVRIEGRLQSRKYIKNNEERTVYEISVNKVAVIK